MNSSVSGKTVIVTGAANGIGLAIARRFVELGASVVLADKDEKRLAIEVEALQNGVGQAIGYHGNLQEKLTINNLMAATIDAFESIDILVNASRQILPSDPLVDKDGVFEQLMHQNVTVNLRLAQAVAKRMIAHTPDRSKDEVIGSIVNLSSIAATRTMPELMAYSVSSAALDQLTRSLAVAFADHGIRVNGIAMGSLMSASLRESLKDNDDLHGMIEAATPLGHIGEAGEAADAAVFLASSRANFITGQILAVDGGRSLIDTVTIPAH
ncbi:MAG: SDR family oxidoreductase [Paracoccaceae bacterium]|jgi:7-alpha-hydroxysteroid dehydrogenase